MEIRIPSVGESVREALLARWLKNDGMAVQRDEPICEIETDKITMELNAEADGILTIKVEAGKTVPIGTLIGTIRETQKAAQPRPQRQPEMIAAPEPPPEVAEPRIEPAMESPPVSPAVRKLAREKGIDPESLTGTGRGGRVTVDDLLERMKYHPPEGKPAKGIAEAMAEVKQLKGAPPGPLLAKEPVEEPQLPLISARQEEANPEPVHSKDGRTTRRPMTPIRKRIAERLLAARQQMAMLTTFNEVELSKVIAMRKKHREHFRKKHGVDLGYMSFFVKAAVEALKEYPLVNARIDGNDIVMQNFYDIAIAISGDKGLVTPVIRDADRLHMADIEKAIESFVSKIANNTLGLADLEGGTFTITNGGVFGSLLSTPIINPPQCAVLGMHAIQERPIALNNKVVVRPMMYLALTYDHRLIDGREAVLFLKKVKEYLEDPEEILLEG
jgi:2-oxoglutarate dehydrogenase E2 component (dihydrolipoamide succinyltransferase)